MKKFEWQKLFLELLVVFLGVTAGFILNNWRENQVEEAQEIAYLEAFRDDLQANHEEFQRTIAFDSVWMAELEPLIQGMASGNPARDSMIASIPRLLNLSRPSLQTSTYGAIIGSGSLGIISDFQLRSDIAGYHISIEELQSLEDYHMRYFQELIMPFIYTNYGLLSGVTDPESFSRRTEVENAYVGFYSLVDQQIQVSRMIMDENSRLMAKIDSVLAR